LLRKLSFILVLIVALFSLGCGPSLDNACGLGGVIPSDLPENTVVANLEGAPFSQNATVTLNSNGSITAGLLSIIIARDETGTLTEDLILRRAFPICIPLGERADDVGQAIYDGTYNTNENNTGMLSILSEEEGAIFGRFESQVGDTQGGPSLTFSEGAFNIEVSP